MRITDLGLTNYRAFEGTHRLKLRPITLLYGYNHTGKSALLRALALLAESARGRHPGPLALASDVGRGATWDDLKNKVAPRRQAVEFVLEGDLGGTPLSPFSLRLAFDQDIEQRRVHTRAIELQVDGSTILNAELALEAAKGHTLLRARLLSAGTSDASAPAQSSLTLEPGALVFDPAAIVRAVSGLAQPTLGPALQAMTLPAALLSDLAAQTQWLGSIRARPPRRAAFMGAPPDRMSHDGQGRSRSSPMTGSPRVAWSVGSRSSTSA